MCPTWADIPPLESGERTMGIIEKGPHRRRSMESAVDCLEAYLVMSREVPSRGMVAIPAESYPRFLRIVNPSRRYSLAFSDPTTPAMRERR
jgi:hypothetical protein